MRAQQRGAPAHWQSNCRPRAHRLAAVSAASTALQQELAYATAKSVAVDKISLQTSLLTNSPVLAAARDLPAGDAVLSVPDAAWLSVEVVKASAIGPFVAELEPWVQLALFLIHVRHAGGRADCAALVAALPAALDTPLLWTDDELALLSGTQLLQSASSYRAFFEQRFAALREGLFAAQPAAFPSASFSFANFLWAVCTVRSRAHAPLEGASVALAPLASALSHRRGGKLQWKVKSLGCVRAVSSLRDMCLRSDSVYWCMLH